MRDYFGDRFPARTTAVFDQASYHIRLLRFVRGSVLSTSFPYPKTDPDHLFGYSKGDPARFLCESVARGKAGEPWRPLFLSIGSEVGEYKAITNRMSPLHAHDRAGRSADPHCRTVTHRKL